MNRSSSVACGIPGIYGRDDALATFTVLTTDPNELTATIHDRMPLIIAPRTGRGGECVNGR